MGAEEGKIKPGVLSKWLIHIGVQVDCNQTATVVGAEWNLTAWIG